MLQQYLDYQVTSTREMEKNIEYVQLNLGEKMDVLFNQVIKLDKDIKQLKEDHDRSLNLIKLDVAAKYHELLSKSIGAHRFNDDNCKHLGILYNRMSAVEESLFSKNQREQTPTPKPPPFPCNVITAISKEHSSHLARKEEEEHEYKEDYEDDEEEKQNFNSNASSRGSETSPQQPDPRFSPPPAHTLALPRISGIQRNRTIPDKPEDSFQYAPIDPTKISPEKLKEFNKKVKSIPFYVPF